LAAAHSFGLKSNFSSHSVVADSNLTDVINNVPLDFAKAIGSLEQNALLLSCLVSQQHSDSSCESSSASHQSMSQRSCCKMFVYEACEANAVEMKVTRFSLIPEGCPGT
jgi:hypothetical protein